MTRPAIVVIGLLLGGASLTALCLQASRPTSTDPSPPVINPAAVLFRAPPGNLALEISVAFSPDGRTVAAGLLDYPRVLVSLWDAASRRQTANLEEAITDSFFCAVAFSPDGGTLALGTDELIKHYDTARALERRPRAFEGPADFQWRVSSTDGRGIIVAPSEEGLIIRDLVSGRRLASVADSSPDLMGVVVSPDGKWVACLSAGPLVCHRTGGGLFGSGARGWACGPDSSTVQLFEAATGRERSSFTDDFIEDVSFSPDGKWLASCSGRDAKLRDLATGQFRSIIQVKEGFLISRVTFAPDGQTLAVAVSSSDLDRSLGEVRLWDLRWGRVRAILRDPIGEVLSMAFAPNGKALVTGSRKAIVLWDL